VCQESEIGEAERQGGPHGASGRLRIDASFHLPGVPIWNGYPVHLSRGWSREVQTGSMPLLVCVEIAEGVY
jgi:hypothetical protein